MVHRSKNGDSITFEARLRLALEAMKVVALLFGGVGLFLLVTRPESILNRASSQDAIARERAKLVLDWIREGDPERRAEAFEVIRAAYGEDDWISEIELALSERAKQEARAAALHELAELLRMREELKRKAEAELHGATGNPPGLGPAYEVYRAALESLDAQIVGTRNRLDKLGFFPDERHALPSDPLEEP